MAEVILMKNFLNVGEDNNLNVCWWKLFGVLVKLLTYNFIYIHQQNISPTYISSTSRRSRSCMLVPTYRLFINMHFSPTSFTSIRTACELTDADPKNLDLSNPDRILFHWKHLVCCRLPTCNEWVVILCGQDDSWPSMSNPWGDCKSWDQWFDGDLEKCYGIFWKSSLLDRMDRTYNRTFMSSCTKQLIERSS